MTSAVRLAVSWLLRAPGRSSIRVLVLAASVALLGGMLLFVGNSLRTVAGSAVRSVPLDLQGPVSSYDQARAVAGEVARQSGVLQASPAATAPLTGSEHRGPNGLTSSGAGAVLAVPLDYGAHIHTFRFLQGALRPGAVVLDQQMAATLQAHIGDRVTLNAPGLRASQTYPVSGVALVTASDKLFQPLNPQLGPAPAQPPANVAIMPLHTFASTLARAIPTISAAGTAANAQPGAQTGVQWQVQTQLDPAALSTGSPSAALERATQTRNRIERTLPGRVQFVDNLSESLNTAATDALYAETLYIMLAVPGALIALGLAYLAALGTVERDRRDLALLRARGARRRDLLVLAGIESLILGLVAGLLGTAAGFGAVSTLVAGGAHASTGRVLSIGAICVLLASAGAGAARVGASLSSLRMSVATGQRGTRREGKPLWQRLYLDIACLAISGLIYWLTASTGFSAVVNPDSNPTLSLSVYMFFAPALLWVGATLLLVRLRGRALSWVIARVVRGRAIASRPRLFLLISAGRRGAAINRGLLVVGLLLAFGVNLGIFSATYNQQVKVDAQLTLGADVTATAAPGVASQRNLARRIAAVPGVAATTGVEHSYAYVGPDLQDTYGIDASSFGKATSLRDSYFIGSTAQQVLVRLRSTRDGIVVSKETITDFSLRNGDLLRLRVLDQRTGQFHVVPFHVAGIVQEFPSAPKDSFMVANLSYLESVTHTGGPNVVFAKVNGYPPDVARRVAAATSSLGTRVDNITDQGARTSSSITTVDLTGISHIEQAFAIVLAAAAMALFVALGISERRQEFATMAAIGAPLSRISAFLWTEAAIVLSVGLALAIGLGWLLSEMLVAILQHVFDPPPDALAVPWSFLAGLAGAAILATLLATALATRGIRRLRLGEILREQ
ncbi:MAG TPA: ABC transporter permease [Solirubrobacteraceae bacterium]|jgi:putative ABC transport system permease protein|nr:ABC transporter permease [Solirubrobacteraceae bacterium]